MHQCNNFNVIFIADSKQLFILFSELEISFIFLSQQSVCWFVVVFRALSWEEARQQCLLQGTDLAEMNNIDEQRAFTKFLNNWRKLLPFTSCHLKGSRDYLQKNITIGSPIFCEFCAWDSINSIWLTYLLIQSSQFSFNFITGWKETQSKTLYAAVTVLTVLMFRLRNSILAGRPPQPAREVEVGVDRDEGPK